jgi:hypothetical protein
MMMNTAGGYGKPEKQILGRADIKLYQSRFAFKYIKDSRILRQGGPVCRQAGSLRRKGVEESTKDHELFF